MSVVVSVAVVILVIRFVCNGCGDDRDRACADD